MNERLTIDEINARYDSEWVLVEDPATNEALDVQSGVVRFHSADHEKVYRKAAELKLPRTAIFFVGKLHHVTEFAL